MRHMKKILLLVPTWCCVSIFVFGQAGGLEFHSSDASLEIAFTWAKSMALQYKGAPEDPVGAWYESALPPRSAFCMRDVSHQCIGAEMLGMHRENINMFTKFVRNISAAKDWCSYWEIDKFDRPCPADYRNDREFWYNLNANFDLLHACWRSWLWTGDSLYLKDAAFLHFYTISVREYIARWTLQADSLLLRPAYPNTPVPFHLQDNFHRCRGLPSYSEGVPDLKMGVDLVAAIYRGLSSYAAILLTNGDSAAARECLGKAEAYRQRIEADWWDTKASLYHTHYTNDHQFGRAEGETFLLWFGALKDSSRRRRTIEHLLSSDLNVENLSYLPLICYRYGYENAARTLILHLADPGTKRREYPEVSYGIVEAVVQGYMGVEGNAADGSVSTLYRAAEKGESQLSGLPVLNTTLTITHSGPKKSAVRNTGKFPVRWKAMFNGECKIAHVGKKVSGKMHQEKDEQGRILSWLAVTVAPGEEVEVSVR
jgi:hypothetical protein